MGSSDRGRTRERGGPPPEAVGSGTAEAQISALRLRIDELDTVVIGLLQQRARLSAEVQRTRVADQGSSLAPDREQAVRRHFQSGLGARGEDVADAVLLLCRGLPNAPRTSDTVSSVRRGRK
ncbi:chorismate mutase [Streptomyces sp. BK208]|nr:chorismate mutase [Streptomyces sp. BK208]